VYAGTDWAVDMMKKVGFKVLRDETITIENVLNIAGMTIRQTRVKSWKKKLIF
jgi:hypothetical protein